ncbi:MAG: hypothetical protein Q8Q28_06235 [Pseudomonadota bacterium]|nr:hypothetical protein [Pseudomonadota bacterium]
MKRLILLGLLLINGVACAAGNLSAQEVRTLMVGNTIAGFNEIKSMEYTVYFQPEGKIVLVTAQGKRLGNWRLVDDGHFCSAFPAEPELCTHVTPYGEGAYRRLKDDGTVTHTLKKFTPGNVNNY